MKPSEFYEKYWLVNGQHPQPLTQEEKDSLDEKVASPINYYHMRIERRATGEVIEIDIEKLKKQMKKQPKQP